jgi:succinate dehydrogenase / fumarate reductase, membrane anchor subunit
MKWENSAFKNPMARARGLGSAQTGLHHWLMQKFTAVTNIILSLWLICSLAQGYASNHAGVEAFLQNPVNAGLLILFLLSSFYHALLGVTVVIEDYVHSEGVKLISLFALKFIMIAGCILSIISVLKLAL